MKRLCILASLPIFFLTACGEKEARVTSAGAEKIDLRAFFSSESHEAPQAIHVVRKTASPGDLVTIKGRVMGRNDLFVEGRAAFILGDPELLTACSDIPDDDCKTPWDTCCDSKESRRDGTATIQLRGAGGRVLAKSLKGEQGLKELSVVTVKGTIDEHSSADSLIINAQSIHVVP